MDTILFDRTSLLVSGVNRDKFPYEIEIKNVDVSSLTKQIPYKVEVDKTDEEGNLLYILPLEDRVIKETIEVQVETIAETEFPVMETVSKTVPLLDKNNKQVYYHPTVEDENGEMVEDTSQKIYCSVGEEREQQKRNADGDLLYYMVEDRVDERFEKQEPIEILDTDERFIDRLERAFTLETRYFTVSFSENPEKFSYSDIVKLKEEQLLNGTFFAKALLFEQMDEELFSTSLASFNSDLGFDFISIPPGGEVRTEKIVLPNPASIIGLKVESSVEGLEIKVGDRASDLQALMKNERVFSANVAEVYVSFKNPTDKRVDVHSFALLV
jgi:hypothetical protein